MMEKGDSWQAGIEILKQNRDKLEAQLGKNQVERLLFNLEEIVGWVEARNPTAPTGWVSLALNPIYGDKG